jgi:nucleotide-binding universal stress UspA family protein
VIPDQTAPGQARMQFEDRAVARLDDFEEMLTDAGATVERRLVFTHDGEATVDRMIYEHECIAVLIPEAIGSIEDILVAIRGPVGLDRIARVVAGLFGGTNTTVTLYHVAEDEDAEGSELLADARERLVELGMDAAAIETRIDRDADRVDAIADAAEGFDVVVVGESDPTITTFVFGMTAEKVAEQFLGPVLVVQRERPETEDTKREGDDEPQDRS